MSNPGDTPSDGRRRRAGQLGRALRALRGFRRKDWDQHVGELRDMAQSSGFRRLRTQILSLAEPTPQDHVLDVGAGTGLLALALAPKVARVTALDVSGAMCNYLRGKAGTMGLQNLDVVKASAISIPLPSASLDLVVSNYCFHHLRDADKDRALGELRRVLRPGGRLVFADMMFRVGLVDPRNRAVVAGLVGRLLKRGPAGVLRIAKNAFRYVTGRWEQPAEVDWWQTALERAGFTEVSVRALEHEGGIAFARSPVGAAARIPAG